MPFPAVSTVAVELLDEVIGIITDRGALSGGGGPVLSAINAILRLEDVGTRARAGEIFGFVRRAMLGGIAAGDIGLTADEIADILPVNRMLFGTRPEGRRYAYMAVIDWTDPFTGQRRTSQIAIESAVALTADEVAAGAAAELSEEYQLRAADLQVSAPELVGVKWAARRF